MEVIDCFLCCECYDKGINSYVGSSVVGELMKGDSSVPEITRFFNIKEDLLNGSIKSIDEFIAEVRMRVFYIVKLFGNQTDIGYGMKIIEQIIIEELDCYVVRDLSNWMSSISVLTDSIKTVLPQIPGNRAQYIENLRVVSLHEKRSNLEKKNATLSKPAHPNIEKLYDQINRLKNDDDIEHVVRILTNFEPQISRKPGFIEAKLEKCNLYVLSLLENYISKCQLKEINPPPPSTPPSVKTPQRTPSTPTNNLPNPLRILPPAFVQNLIMSRFPALASSLSQAAANNPPRSQSRPADLQNDQESNKS